jgi:hypothetical protein
VNADTGKTEWALPPGGVLRRDAQAQGAVNPLYNGGAAASASGSGVRPASSLFPTVWQRVVDGGDVWFVNHETGESVWDLPPGGVLIKDDMAR